MTALAPRPQDEDSVDLATELDGLRRRADDQATLLRKHQAAVTQLADTVAALVTLGKKRNRWINLNSFVAYVLFTVLLGGAMLVVYRSRVRELEAGRALAIAERDQARAAKGPPVVDHAAALAALTPAERALLAAPSTAQTPAPAPAVAPAADDGSAQWKAGAWADAAPRLDRAITAAPDAPHAAQLRYYLGVAKWKLGDYRAAADQLERALAGTLDAQSNDARYFFAAALDKSGELDRARVEYDRFATQYPKNTYAVYARRRSALLARKLRTPATAPAAGATAPKPAVTPAAMDTLDGGDKPAAPSGSELSPFKRDPADDAGGAPAPAPTTPSTTPHTSATGAPPP